MKSFRTAIPILTRVSKRSLYQLPRSEQSWHSKPIARSLHYRASPILRESRLYAPAEEGKPEEPKIPRPPPPSYELTFTCTPCSARSTHRVSKQGYHQGSVLITCPSCKNKHVISDHLNIFGDRSLTVEDLMRERGQLVKKGTLSEDGSLEFWEDGTATEREGKTGTASEKVAGELE